jgi:hypothetical protein
MTTSATGNFDFLSPLTLVGRVSTGGGIRQETNVDHKTLPRQIIYAVPGGILRNNQGNVTENSAVLQGAACVGSQEKMSCSIIVSKETGKSDSFAIVPLQCQLYIISGDTVQPTSSKNPSQSLSIDIGGDKDRSPSQFVGVLNLNAGSSGVPVVVGTSADSFLVASEGNANVITANFPVLVTHQPLVPNVFYQSQVLSP